jgi:hypothetical protein
MSRPKCPPATVAGEPFKRLPRPPRDLRPGPSGQVSRARRACCGPVEGASEAPSDRRMCPPARSTLHVSAQARRSDGGGHDTIMDTKATRGPGDERDEALRRGDESRASLARRPRPRGR